MYWKARDEDYEEFITGVKCEYYIKEGIRDKNFDNYNFIQSDLTSMAAQYSEESILNSWAKLIAKHVG